MWKRNRYDVFSRLSRTHEGDVSRSRHLTLNTKISHKWLKNTAIVAIEFEQETVLKFSNGTIFNDFD